MAVCRRDILLNEYRTDVPCYTLSWFQERNIKEEKLRRWQDKYGLVYPWDLPYNTLRLSYNRTVQYFPLFIARVRDVKAIQWVLRFCHRYNAPFSIRSGAHSWLGFSSSEGVIIDLSKYDQTRILDLSSGIVEVQAGARIGEMVLELSKHGLAVPAGTCQNTAVGGLTLGGGVGFLNRKYGLTLDNLLAVHIILEDGSHVEATKEGNYADLFWACQGAGNGNFGVVTSFVFKARKIKVVTLFELWFDYSHMIELLEKWQVWSVEVSKDITSEIDIVNDPNNPGPILLTGQSESGDLRSALEIFFHLKPVQARIWETSYADSVRHHGTPLDKTNWFFYQNTAFLPKALLHSALEILLENLQNAPNGHKLELLALGGKISKVPSTATAFPWRASQHWLHLQAAWRDPLQAHNMTRYSEKLFQELYPFLVDPNIGTIQAYVNFPSLELGSSYPRAYWGENYPRLQRIKAKYDPCNFFRTPQPIVGCHMT